MPGDRRLRRWGRILLPLAGLGLLFYLTTRESGPHRPAFEATTITLDGGLRIRAVRAGEGDTTLVFLHGFGESLLAWKRVLGNFTARYRVLAIDLPGFGLSDPLPDSSSVHGYLAALGSLLRKETTGPLVLVGHSMGGELAAGLALAEPRRVVAAVLIAPAGAGLNGVLGDSGAVSPWAHWIADAVPHVLPVHDPLWLREPAETPARQAQRDSMLALTARRVLEQFDFAAIGGRFGELRQPVLLIWGRQDPTIPVAVGDRIAETLPCRRYVVLPALHRPHQTRPDTVVTEVDRFLRRRILCGGTEHPPPAPPGARADSLPPTSPRPSPDQ